jgi:hypothetical protein
VHQYQYVDVGMNQKARRLHIATRGGAKEVHLLQVVVQVLAEQCHIPTHALLLCLIQLSERIG